jgi:hypothetical protein
LRAKRNDGKELESRLSAALLQHQTTHKSTYLRFYDAVSSGGRGHAQSGDFLWAMPANAVLIECKSSETGADIISLIKSSKTSKSQLPKHRLWHIAGNLSLYVYANIITREVCFYDGISVLVAVKSGNREDLKILGVCTLTSIFYLLETISTQIRKL